ncbi:AMP-binding enzyme [Desulfuribacillus alkaliarsenatis]|uniref:AMP-binding enzyme C-terminal domain-containing protein n=1 Tax=Desulfuribacillus alkaliarsenatis TaxID=766136 RepID=A0A1E5G4V6_9FIRM|nr:acyl-CoA synthetase [Desulfuribacillus alkaliarsenatis]OEF98206.1 hypothetical protein BHF68_00520 [Desulfuribacillus alkaliarsenatis]
MVEAWSPFYYQHHHLELENLLKQHQAVSDAGVVGIPDIIKGELRHAFIRLKDGHVWSDELKCELVSLVEKTYAKDCIPHEFYQVEKMPKTRSGKLSRQQLKTWALDGVQ